MNIEKGTSISLFRRSYKSAIAEAQLDAFVDVDNQGHAYGVECTNVITKLGEERANLMISELRLVGLDPSLDAETDTLTFKLPAAPELRLPFVNPSYSLSLPRALRLMFASDSLVSIDITD